MSPGEPTSPTIDALADLLIQMLAPEAQPCFKFEAELPAELVAVAREVAAVTQCVFEEISDSGVVRVSHGEKAELENVLRFFRDSVRNFRSSLKLEISPKLSPQVQQFLPGKLSGNSLQLTGFPEQISDQISRVRDFFGSIITLKLKLDSAQSVSKLSEISSRLVSATVDRKLLLTISGLPGVVEAACKLFPDAALISREISRFEISGVSSVWEDLRAKLEKIGISDHTSPFTPACHEITFPKILAKIKLPSLQTSVRISVSDSDISVVGNFFDCIHAVPLLVQADADFESIGNFLKKVFPGDKELSAEFLAKVAKASGCRLEISRRTVLISGSPFDVERAEIMFGLFKKKFSIRQVVAERFDVDLVENVSVTGHDLKRIESETGTFLQLCKEMAAVLIVSHSAANRSSAKQELENFQCSSPSESPRAQKKRWLKYKLPAGLFSKILFQVMPDGGSPAVDALEHRVNGTIRSIPGEDEYLEISSFLTKPDIWKIMDEWVDANIQFVSCTFDGKHGNYSDLTDARHALLKHENFVSISFPQRNELLLCGRTQVMDRAVQDLNAWVHRRGAPLRVSAKAPKWGGRKLKRVDD